MELTQEYFDLVMKNVATKTYLDERLNKQTEELKAFAKEQTEELARIIAEAVDKPLQAQQVEIDSLKEKISKLEMQVSSMTTSFKKIEDALHISLLEKA